MATMAVPDEMDFDAINTECQLYRDLSAIDVEDKDVFFTEMKFLDLTIV